MSEPIFEDTQVDDPRIGMVLQDRYRIVRKLGEGGMGAVYEGEHMLIKRRVAIKALHAQFAMNAEIVKRFHNEALAATAIGHENIIEVTDMGRFDDGSVFMVLEYLDGRDWADDIESGGPQPVGRVVRILLQVCDALAAAHAKGIIHRDLKPENIFLIRRSGNPDFAKVLDFGISKMKDAAAPGSSMTRTGTTLGTPYYMAPEQAQGKRSIDHRADIYSLGVILFQALTGQYPFDDDSYPMLVLKICTEPPPDPLEFRPDLPHGLVGIITRLLQKDPAARFQDCASLRAALEPYAHLDQAPVAAASAMSTANRPPSALASDPNFVGGATMAATPVGPTPPAVTGPVTGGAPPVAQAMAAPLGAQPTGPVMAPGVVPQPATEPQSPEAVTPSSGVRPSSTPSGGASKTPLFLGLAVLLVGGGVAIATMGGGPEPAPEPVPTVATPAPSDAPPAAAPPTEAASFVRITIRATPSDAELFLDGDRVANPFEAELPAQEEPRRLEARAEGHTTVLQDLVMKYSQNITIELERGEGTDDQRHAERRIARERRREREASMSAPMAAPMSAPIERTVVSEMTTVVVAPAPTMGPSEEAQRMLDAADRMERAAAELAASAMSEEPPPSSKLKQVNLLGN
ncbi:MAG: protein kinase [Myxococcota bacterium]